MSFSELFLSLREICIDGEFLFEIVDLFLILIFIKQKAFSNMTRSRLQILTLFKIIFALFLTMTKSNVVLFSS